MRRRGVWGPGGRGAGGVVGTIKYLHKRTAGCKEDKAELIQEISFGNPNFQEEIDQEAMQGPHQNWWKQLLIRSRASVDSAYQQSSESSGDLQQLDDLLTPDQVTLLEDDDTVHLI